MITLNPAQRRELKARAHHLRPIVMISGAGLTSTVLHEIDIGLKSHELIKIRVLGDDRTARTTLIRDICAALDAAAVQHIGKILVVYRPRPDDARKPHADNAPGPATRIGKNAGKKGAGSKDEGRKSARKRPRRTKRSYQSG